MADWKGTDRLQVLEPSIQVQVVHFHQLGLRMSSGWLSKDKSAIEVSVNNEQPETALVDLYNDTSIDPVYHAKARILNEAIQNIGMGRYQVGQINR